MVELAAGNWHSCVRLEYGGVYCWGSNSHGQSGDPDPMHGLVTTPLAVARLGGEAQQLGLGAQFSCAGRGEAGLFCWGRNDRGQLGNGTTADDFDAVPGQVVDLPRGLVQLSAGFSHICGVFDGGAVHCWGDNEWGQVGNSMTGDGRHFTRPQAVAGLVGIEALSSGGGLHSCALDDGSVLCWGYNSRGQLGNGSGGGGTDHESIPRAIADLTGMRGLGIGNRHSCAQGPDSILCWGAGFYGKLGNGEMGSAASFYNIPVRVKDISMDQSPAAVASGFNHSCAIVDNARVVCWGANFDGQLGNGKSGSDAHSAVPVLVTGLGGAVHQIVVGNDHSCARLATGDVQCWGDNADGQLGTGSLEPGHSPVPVYVKGFGG